jgi:hypothetical protein
MKLTVGKVKLWAERLRGYLIWAQFAMVVYLFILQKPFGLEWYVILGFVGVVSALLLAFDITVVLPQEYSYVFEKTPPMAELRDQTIKRLKRIEKLLGG